MATQAQLDAFIVQQEQVNTLLNSWADYGDAQGTNVPAAVCRAAANISASALDLLRAE